MRATASAVVLASAAALLLATACAGCAGFDEVIQQPQPGTLTGTIQYDGPAAAPGRQLAIAVYDSYPPNGAPLRTVLVDVYDFPYTFVFEGLAPGTYYIGAAIDVDRMDTRWAGMLNEARDPFGYADEGAGATIDAHLGVAGLLVELKDPEP